MATQSSAISSVIVDKGREKIRRRVLYQRALKRNLPFAEIAGKSPEVDDVPSMYRKTQVQAWRRVCGEGIEDRGLSREKLRRTCNVDFDGSFHDDGDAANDNTLCIAR